MTSSSSGRPSGQEWSEDSVSEDGVLVSLCRVVEQHKSIFSVRDGVTPSSYMVPNPVAPPDSRTGGGRERTLEGREKETGVSSTYRKSSVKTSGERDLGRTQLTSVTSRRQVHQVVLERRLIPDEGMTFLLRLLILRGGK